METTNQTSAQQEDKTAAILSYITLIGFIIAIVMQGSNKTKLGSYHLKQALGVICTGVAAWILMMIIAFIPFVNFLLIILAPAIWIFILVLVIMGVINAANGQFKPLPLFGSLYEKLFASTFN